MYNYKIGAMVESFRVDTFDAIRKAAEIGVDGLQLGSNYGPNAPENMTEERKAEIAQLLADLAL